MQDQNNKNDMTADELWDASERFFVQKKYDELLSLLNDETLEKHNDARLYRWQGNTFFELGEYEKSIEAANKEIKVSAEADSYYCRGLSLNKLGRFENAIIDFVKAISLNQFEAGYYEGRANALFNIGEHDSALRDYNQSIALNPQNSFTYHDRGSYFSNTGELDKAIKDYSKAILLENNNAKYYFSRGKVLFKKNDYASAITDFTQAILLDGQKAEYYYFRGESLLLQGHDNDAIDDYTKSILIKEHSIPFFRRGLAWYNLKIHDKAIVDITKSIELEKENAEYYYLRSKVLTSKKKFDEAIIDLGFAININGNEAKYYSDRGHLLHNTGKIDNAIEDFTKAIEIDAKDSKTYFLRSVAWFNKKNYEKAINDIDRSINLDATLAHVHAYKGMLLEQVGDYNKAIEVYTQAINLQDKPGNYCMRGTCYGRNKNYSEAIEDLTKAISLKDDNAEYYSNRGITWGLIKEYDKAISDFTQAILLDDKKADYFLARGNVWLKKKNTENAIRDLSKATLLDGDNTLAFCNRGIAYYIEKRNKIALQDFNKAIELGCVDANCFYYRGLVHVNKNKLQDALYDFKRVIELDPKHTDAKNIRDFVNIRLGNKVEIDATNLSSIIQVIVKILDTTNASESYKNKILKNYLFIKANILDKIRKHSADGIDKIVASKRVAHYTKLQVANIFTTNSQDTKMHYYNAIYMNDPQEGTVLLDCMDKDVQHCFENASKQEEDNIYIGSFLPAEKHEDELVMWRTYGKDENQVEAAGCSLIINTDFFDNYSSRDGYTNPQMLSDKNATSANTTPQCLYRVLYYDKHHLEDGLGTFKGDNGDIIAKDVIQLNKKLKKIVALKDKKNIDAPINIAIDKIIYHILSEVRFFFKSADYEFENEVRVIQMATKSNKLLQINNTTHPHKVYLESNKPIQPYLEKIILGPKVLNPKRWIYLDVAMRKNNAKFVSVELSECKYQ